MKNENFYNAVSPYYDSMISFEKSLEKRKAFYEMVFAKRNIVEVADLGCGSGLDSLALAGMGYKVTGFDPSSEMIQSAQNNATTAKLDIKFYRKSILNIPEKFSNKFDCVVSFGNTLANINQTDLHEVFKRISNLLKPGGCFLLQILNYERILMQKETIIGFSEKEDLFIVRFNEFMKGEINFHFLAVNKKMTSASKHFSTKIYPHTQKLISTLLHENEFSHTKYYGSLALEKFSRINSKDLVLFTNKKE